MRRCYRFLFLPPRCLSCVSSQGVHICGSGILHGLSGRPRAASQHSLQVKAPFTHTRAPRPSRYVSYRKTTPFLGVSGLNAHRGGRLCLWTHLLRSLSAARSIGWEVVAGLILQSAWGGVASMAKNAAVPLVQLELEVRASRPALCLASSGLPVHPLSGDPTRRTNHLPPRCSAAMQALMLCLFLLLTRAMWVLSNFERKMTSFDQARAPLGREALCARKRAD